MVELTHISLFSGIGGDTLAAQWAGFRTILFVETDAFCQKVLKKHWPDVPIIGDIKDATKETMADTDSSRYRWWKNNQGQSQTERGRFEQDSERASADNTATDNQPITLIIGGFPCQPVSIAGQRRGKEDDRWLWPEMLRVISEVRPTWVVAENVTGLLHMGFHDCLSDLEGEGYETISFVIPACSVNAPHRRDRIFIVAHNEGGRLGQKLSQLAEKLLSEDRASQESEGNGGDVADTAGNRGKAGLSGQGQGQEGQAGKSINQGENVADPEFQSPRHGKRRRGQILRGELAIRHLQGWWSVEPDVGRVAHGIPSRVDRLRGLGNAIVPQQIYPILKAIADIERTK